MDLNHNWHSYAVNQPYQIIQSDRKRLTWTGKECGGKGGVLIHSYKVLMHLTITYSEEGARFSVVATVKNTEI